MQPQSADATQPPDGWSLPTRMANVFMLNLGYDVNVKLFSFHLLAMGAFLMLPELRRLNNVFILNRPAQPVSPPPLFRRRWLNAGMLAAQLAVLVYCGTADLYQAHADVAQSGDLAPPPPLYGIYAVDEFAVDGAARPPLFTDEQRWHRFVFDKYNLIGIQLASGAVERYRYTQDLKAGSLGFAGPIAG